MSYQPPVSIRSLDDLEKWLAHNNLRTSEWGTGGAKRVEELWRELRDGECILTDNPPERRVSVVLLMIRRGGRTLTEVSQLFDRGDVRQKGSPPTEKMRPGESVEAAAIRCAAEELGVTIAPENIIRGSHVTSVERVGSPSYPGLTTCYTLHQIEARIADLPESAFSTHEASDSADNVVRVHYWDWR